MENSTKVVTGKVRFSYVFAFEPEPPMGGGGGKPKYAVTLLIPKSDVKTLRLINTAIEAAKVLGKAKQFNGTIPAGIKTPLRDGDVEKPDSPGYAGHYFMKAKSGYKPGVVDLDGQPIMDASELYSGCYGRASVSFFAYNEAGNRGIGCGLNNLQKLQDGESLVGRSSAEEDFADGARELVDDLM